VNQTSEGVRTAPDCFAASVVCWKDVYSVGSNASAIRY